MLRSPADAADAVQDTFVIAAAKLGQLRDPDRLRTWLYAVARNECHRRLRSRETTPGLDEVPEVSDEGADVSADAERAELQRLVRDALAGLNAGDREVLELNLRHDFEGAELAEALGVTRNYAHAMLSRARNQLKTSLGALLVARTGRQSCEELDRLLGAWDGTMTVLLRKQINRHIESCDICGDRRKRELAPAALFSLLPLPLLPPGLRERIIRLVADTSPSATSYKHTVVQRAGTFGPSGFPPPAAAFAGAFAGSFAARAVYASRRNVMIVAPAAVALIAAVVVIIALAATGSPGGGGPVVAAAGTPAPVVTASPSPASSSPAAALSTSAPPSAKTHPAKSVAAVIVTTSGPASPASTPAPATSSPASHPASHTASHSAAPKPHPSASTPHTSPPPTSASPSAVPGTVQVSVSSVVLQQGPQGGPATGSFTLTAVGGPVFDYSIVINSGALTATPSSGTLGEGDSVTIVLTLTADQQFVTTILIDPGQIPVTVSFKPAPPSDS
jgi:RNA polymerase sigma factor (sigma-70 family)